VTDKTWKAVERKYAEMFGGKRIPITGRIRGSAPDIQHEWLSFEVKHRKALPAWIHDAMNQAEMSKKGNQLPIVILHQNRMKYEEGFVVLRVKDFLNWFGK